MAELVSIIIPIFNGERFLRAAIDSALAQTHRPIEIICVDDGSTDATSDILRTYGDQILTIRQDNQGLPGARNSGIARAHGEWIAFLDADDVWDRRKLEIQLLHAPPRSDVIHCATRVIDERGSVLAANARPSGFIKEPTFGDLLRRNHLAILTVVVRKRAGDAVGWFDATNRIATEDWHLWLKLAARRCRYGYVDEVLASYRVHSQNMSGNSLRMALGRLHTLRRVEEELGSALEDPDRRTLREQRRSQHFDAGYCLYQAADYGAALRHFIASVVNGPRCPRAWIYAAACALPLRSLVIPRVRRGIQWARGRRASGKREDAA